MSFSIFESLRWMYVNVMKALLSRDCCRDFLSISLPAIRYRCDGNHQPYPAAKDIILIPVTRRRGRHAGLKCMLCAGVPDCCDASGTKDVS
ncbi:Nitrogen assimilation transcription factor nirA [Fusarium oxysporum f. sp. albedinis]|nr:Nitrogen assimilation transcription factor nirA [Fusarium oxysporum f. sp. albedinis]